MESNGVVLSRLVASAGRSLAFYRDGLEIADASTTDGIVALNLPGLRLFLAELDMYAHNTGQDRDASGNDRPRRL